MEDRLFTLPLPEVQKMQGWRKDSYVESTERRNFTNNVNALLISLQDASTDYMDHHPDTKGEDVARHNIEIIQDLFPKFIAVAETLVEQSKDYGFDMHDDYQDAIDMLEETTIYWEKELRE